MKARYLGNPNPEDDGPRRVGFAGKDFPRGVFIDVSDIPAALKSKLVAHPNFETSDEAITDEDIAAAEAVNGPAETATGDQLPEPAGGKKTASKATLIAELEALQVKHPELTFDPKWGAPKLSAALEAARFEYGDED